MDNQIIQTKFKAGRYLIPVQMTFKGKRIYFKYKFNRTLINEIKSMKGARWHGFDEPPLKQWSVENCSRNLFQIAYLEQKNPYKNYEGELIDYKTERPLRKHQIEQVRFTLTKRHCVIAAQMGTGKTLSAIEVMEAVGGPAWYVGPKSGVKAVELELIKWDAKVRPTMMTYERLVKNAKLWKPGDPIPKVVIFDESSKLKTPTAQRSQAAMWLAEAVREVHGRDGIIMEMSGTPAPKSPRDWWHQAEVACPGFLKEGDINKFQKRLCLIEQRENMISGGVYPHIVTWLDDENKCAICGEFEEHENHTDFGIATGGHHFKKSKNEVEFLYKRLKGLVLVQFSKDCLDLPELIFEEIKIKPTVDIIHAAKIINANARSAIQALTLARELSDGFQYKQREKDKVQCPNCKGAGKTIEKVPNENVDIDGPNNNLSSDDFHDSEVICDNCGGVGKIPRYENIVEESGSPKDDYFINDLQNHEEVGRYIVWGGFTGAIDRLVRMANKQGWAVLRVDGRGYHGFDPKGDKIDSTELLIAMDRSHKRYKELLEKYPLVCFVGHPQAGGMALTLHASPTSLFYSNCFDGGARMQAVKRGHRMGMDESRGHIIKDLIMLPSDKLVLDNLTKKVKLQNLTMGELNRAISEIEKEQK